MIDLNSLGMSNTRITDAGLENLKGMRDLRTLFLSGTKITDAGIEELKRANPRVNVFR